MLRAMIGVRVPSLALVLLALACSKQAPASAPAAPTDAATAPASLPDRDPALAHRLVEQQGGVLLDVRTPEEFEAGHVDGAHNVPHDAVEARMDEIDQITGGKTDTPIVVYCRSGRRAAAAKQTLVERGYSQVTNLGGMEDW